MPEPSTPVLWRFSDGKGGHDSQSRALAQHLANLRGFRIHEVPVQSWGRYQAGDNPPRPDLVLGAGHRTHLPLLRAARRHDCPSVVIMKPSLPAAFFDLCLVPEHDLKGDPSPNMIATRGPLNLIPRDLPAKQDLGLLLIGGPSKHHGWNGEVLAAAVAKVVAERAELSWELTDSRRTPDEFLAACPQDGLAIHHYRDTDPGWLPGRLATAREVWVTEDSASMVYEALTARCGVGLLPMPAHSERSRVVRGIRRLVTDGWVTPYAGWSGEALPAPPSDLHEASRCAGAVVARLFPDG